MAPIFCTCLASKVLYLEIYNVALNQVPILDFCYCIIRLSNIVENVYEMNIRFGYTVIIYLLGFPL